MSLSDLLALVAIVVSVASAFATIYFQYFERRRVAVALGDEIYLNYGPADGSGGYAGLGVVLSVSLLNAGASDALVTEITATVRHAPNGFETLASWSELYEATDAGTPGKSSSPGWKFKDFVRPLAVPSRTVVTEWIFFTSTPLKEALPLGSYLFELTVTETRPAGTTGEVERRALARWVGDFNLDKPSADYIASSCVATDEWTPSSCRVQMRRRHARVR